MFSKLKIIEIAKLSEDQNVCSFFFEKYKKKPEWVIQCPGRINLIGEHIDYSGYSVLPMAVCVNMILAIGKSCDRQLHFENMDEKKFKSAQFEIKNLFLKYDLKSLPQWFNYFIAGWQGALESIFGISKHSFNLKHLEKIYGLNIAVTSTIPPNAGLSSSSALVCAAVFSTFAVQKNKEALESLKTHNIVEIATKSERFVGVEGGGMDQACECLANNNYALRIDFNPLNIKFVKLPDNALFVVMHSGVEINKASTNYYNQRVIECRLAAQIICKKAGVSNLNNTTINCFIKTLRQAAKFFNLDEKNPNKMITIVNKYLKPKNEFYSRKEICEILELEDNIFNELLVNMNVKDMQKFWLTKRALHVYSEASRVLEFERICNLSTKNFNVLKDLAVLMNESHESCRDLFECSCLELDLAVERSKRAGCLAARLTGAGWGGCVIALVDVKDYKEINMKKTELNILFWSEPNDGIKAYFS